MRRLIWALVLLVLACAAPSAHATALVDVDVGDRASARLIETLPGVESTGHGESVVTTQAGLAMLRAAGLEPRVRIADLEARDRADRRADRAYAAQGASALPSGRSSYRRLGDYTADLARLARTHPKLVKPLSLAPASLEGRTLRGVEISDRVALPDGKPVFLLLGVHHAREWPSGELSMEFAFDLARQYGKDARITALLKRARVVVVPVVNPDGFNASRESPNDPQDQSTSSALGVPGIGAYRRKNCRAAGGTGPTQPSSACEGNPGVDLNRNYGINWGSDGASSSDQAPDYRGAGPFSEPESEAIRRLVASRNVTMLITNHTFGHLVLRPPGVRAANVVPDETRLKAIGDRMAAPMDYKSERSWELYDNSGTTEDWSYGVTGGYGFTIESSDENFHEAYAKAVVREYIDGNREAFLRGLEAAATPADHAVIEGFAPPGRVLRLTRTVASQTGPVCVNQPTGFFSTNCGATTSPLAFSDQLSAARRVGGDGVVGWHVNPSTSPLARQSGPWQLTCEDSAGRVLERRSVAVGRGRSARVILRCGPQSCVTARALRSLSVRTGRAARIGLRLRRGARASRVRVLRVAGGRLRVAARPKVRRGRALWRPRRSGTYVLEVSARAGRRTEVRRRSLIVRGGQVTRGPGFARTDGCGELRVARLSSPAVARTGPRVRLLLRSLVDVKAKVSVSRGKRTLARRTLALRGGRLTRYSLPRASGRRITVKVTTVRGTSALARRSAVTLSARGR